MDGEEESECDWDGAVMEVDEFVWLFWKEDDIDDVEKWGVPGLWNEWDITGEEGIRSSSTILSSSSMSLSRCNSARRCEVGLFQLAKLEARVRAIGVLHGWVFCNPLDGPPREVEPERDWASCAYSLILVFPVKVSVGKRLLACSIAISFASWPMWLLEREDTRSSTEKDILMGVRREQLEFIKAIGIIFHCPDSGPHFLQIWIVSTSSSDMSTRIRRPSPSLATFHQRSITASHFSYPRVRKAHMAFPAFSHKRHSALWTWHRHVKVHSMSTPRVWRNASSL